MSGYVALENSRGVTLGALEQDVVRLEAGYPAYKGKIRAWNDENLESDRIALRGQVDRINRTFLSYASFDDPEGFLENLKVRFTTISREFSQLDKEPAEAKAQLLDMERRKRCIKIGVPCLLVSIIAACVLVILHYELKNQNGL